MSSQLPFFLSEAQFASVAIFILLLAVVIVLARLDLSDSKPKR